MTLDSAACRALAESGATLPVWAWDSTRARLRRAPPGDPINIARSIVAGVLRDLAAGRLERIA